MSNHQAWWGGVLLAMVAVPASAQESEEQSASVTEVAAVTTLAPLQVNGEVLQTALPLGSTITTRRELDERSIQSWEDFSKRGEPGVNFSKANNSINIRGMDQDRVVTRVDGIRIPWLNDGARGEKGGLDTINFNTLSSIDLVRGAGAPQSGSLVGYVNLRTLGPDDLLMADKSFGALLKGGYDSADDSWQANAALAGRLDVNKPTSDGWVTSVECFTQDGDLIVQFFGARKPGIPELANWRELLVEQCTQPLAA